MPGGAPRHTGNPAARRSFRGRLKTTPANSAADSNSHIAGDAFTASFNRPHQYFRFDPGLQIGYLNLTAVYCRACLSGCPVLLRAPRRRAPRLERWSPLSFANSIYLAMKFIRGNYSVRLFAGDCFGGMIAALIALPYGSGDGAAHGPAPGFGGVYVDLNGADNRHPGPQPGAGRWDRQRDGSIYRSGSTATGFGGRRQNLAGGRRHDDGVRHHAAGPIYLPHSAGGGFGLLLRHWGHDVHLAIARHSGGGAAAQPDRRFHLGVAGGNAGPDRPYARGVFRAWAGGGAGRYRRRPRARTGCRRRCSASSRPWSWRRILGLHEHEVGALPAAFPPFVGFSWAPGDVFTVLPSAFGLAVVSSVNLLITSRVVEHFRLRRKHLKRTDADAELGAYGIANLCAGVFAAPMSVGIPARSIAIVRCGGTTRVSNLMHGLFLVAFLQFGAGFVSHIPVPALAGVTAYTGLCLLEWSTWRRLHRMSRADAAAFLITACAVLVVNAIAAVAAGCLIYALRAFYYRFVRPRPESAPPGTPEGTPASPQRRCPNCRVSLIKEVLGWVFQTQQSSNWNSEVSRAATWAGWPVFWRPAQPCRSTTNTPWRRMPSRGCAAECAQSTARTSCGSAPTKIRKAPARKAWKRSSRSLPWAGAIRRTTRMASSSRPSPKPPA